MVESRRQSQINVLYCLEEYCAFCNIQNMGLFKIIIK